MGKRGRRAKPPTRRKDRVIGVRVTDDEYRRMERQAEGQHIPLAAWARARLIASLEAIERDEDATRAADDVRRKQEETLGKTQELLDRTIRLYQSAVEKRGPDESGGGDDGSV